MLASGIRNVLVSAFLLGGMMVPAMADGTAVTVTGAVTAVNRGPFDESTDKLFASNDLTFVAAHAFSRADLEALPQATVSADFPKGGAVVTFSGPKLEDVLAAAGAATGAQIWIQAMDGYAVEVPRSELAAKGAVLALTRDGKDLGIGDFGPAQLVFPRADRADLSDMPDDWWIWQVFHISVAAGETLADQ